MFIKTLNYKLNIIYKLLFITSFCILASCSNRFYLVKNVDKFKPEPHATFNIQYDKITGLYKNIGDFLKVSFKFVPMTYYPNKYASYQVYFNYRKAYWLWPMVGVTVVKRHAGSKLRGTVVYQTVVYSYTKNTKRSIASALALISKDLLNKKYSSSQMITYTNKDLVKDLTKYKQNLHKSLPDDAPFLQKSNQPTTKFNYSLF